MAKGSWHEDSAHVLRVASPEGRFEAYLARPAAPGRPAIVVLHEVFGVNADLRSTRDELAAAGFTAICPQHLVATTSRINGYRSSCATDCCDGEQGNDIQEQK